MLTRQTSGAVNIRPPSKRDAVSSGSRLNAKTTSPGRSIKPDFYTIKQEGYHEKLCGYTGYH